MFRSEDSHLSGAPCTANKLDHAINPQNNMLGYTVFLENGVVEKC
jgi:hypothetical protein